MQLDFNLPERFDMKYVDKDGSRQQPIMIHRAIFGSIERFFGILIENYAGTHPALPVPVSSRPPAHAPLIPLKATLARVSGLVYSSYISC